MSDDRKRFDSVDPAENRLLAALPREEFDRLARQMDEVVLDVGDVVYRAGGPIRHVYFPRSGILSVVVDTDDGGTVEVGTVGREGVAGLAAFLGAGQSPHRVYCQVPPCICRRLPADLFAAEVRRPGPLQSLVFHYAQLAMTLAARSIACNSLHPVEERLARWLLTTHDRVGADEFPLTQQIMSEMLGVRRPSVTVAAGALQKAGLIEYRRGWVVVLDRAGLEAAACECYRVVRDAQDRLLPGPPAPSVR